MFETAVFTDVSAEESLDGSSGFNFQAASEGFDGLDKTITTESLVHRIPRIAKLDAAVHSESFTYIPHRERFYFSRGRSLGKTASGRDGNQLTEIAVAHHVADLGALSPAQVFGAKNWTIEKPAAGHMARWSVSGVGLEIDEDFKVDRLLNWTLSDDSHKRFLAQVLSALESKITSRLSGPLVIIHPDLRIIVKWLATAMALSNQDAVRTLSFRGFDDRPMSARAKVVGYSPKFGHADFSGALVLDAEHLECADLEVSYAVRKTMELLDELYCLEALDIIATARRWDPFVGPERAFWAAELVEGNLSEHDIHDHKIWAPEILGALSESGLSADVSEYREDFVQVLKHCRFDDDEFLMRATDAVTKMNRSGNADVAAQLLDASMSSLFDRPELIGRWAREFNKGTESPWPGEMYVAQWKEKLSGLFEVARCEDLLALLRLAGWLTTDFDATWCETAEQRAASFLWRHPEVLHETDAMWSGGRIRSNLRLRLIEAVSQQASNSNGSLQQSVFVEQLQTGYWQPLLASSQADRSSDATVLARLHDLALVAAQEPKKRRRTIRASKTAFSPEDWRLVLADTRGDHETSLWCEWITSIGATEGMIDHILAATSPRQGQDSKSPAPTWIPVLRALRDIGIQHSMRVERHLEQLETAEAGSGAPKSRLHFRRKG